jgi:hypothetical protein
MSRRLAPRAPLAFESLALTLVALTVVALVAAGCGSSSNQGSSSVAARVLSPSLPPTLPAAAVPYLPSVHRPLTAAFLAREAEVPSLTVRLSGWGYEAGADRYFQGESKRLQLVDSRTLRFRDPAGASAYVAFMRGHLSPILGSFPQVRAFTADAAGRGIVASGQECQCHLANPSFLAVVAHGPTVTWLEINGPGATRRRLDTLIARAP